jgi:hypothetical protein
VLEALNQPLGLSMEILRQRAFASAWEDSKRPRRDDEEPPTGAIYDWVSRIAERIAFADVGDALADLRRIRAERGG